MARKRISAGTVRKQNGQIGFWHSGFPNQLGNLCFIIFLIGLALFVLHAVFDLNVFDPDDFKSTDARIPALGTRRVVDEAGVLTQSEINALTAQIDDYEAATKGQMAVLIIKSLHGDPIEDFSMAVAEKWKIGLRDEDNGVLLLLAMDDRESRLEIGYGLEGVINDARAGDILRDMAPYMRKAQFEKAISFVIASVAAFVLNESGPEKTAGMEEEEEDGAYTASTGNDAEGVLACVIAILIVLDLIGTIVARLMIHPDVKKSVGLIAMIIILRILLEVLKGMARGGGRGGSSGGGRSRSGGGGGSFGGGGASGRW